MIIPRFYKFIIKYVTPLFLFGILGTWFVQQWLPVILMDGIPTENKAYILFTRIGLFTLFAVLAILVKISWQRKRTKAVLS